MNSEWKSDANFNSEIRDLDGEVPPRYSKALLPKIDSDRGDILSMRISSSDSTSLLNELMKEIEGKPVVLRWDRSYREGIEVCFLENPTEESVPITWEYVMETIEEMSGVNPILMGSPAKKEEE